MTRHQLTFLHSELSLVSGVQTASTTRTGGVSEGPFASFNLGDHVGDDPQHVAANRAALGQTLRLPAAPCWLNQVHGAEVAQGSALAACPQADAAVSDTPGEVLAILTADCLPVLLCRRDGRAIAAAHGGWRSLAAGILENTAAAMGGDPRELLAWLGPAIGHHAFEVGSEVRDVFVAHSAQAERAFGVSEREGHYYADLCELARQRLIALGVARVYGGGTCTFANPRRFFSYRRDGECGRMATLIWRDP